MNTKINLQKAAIFGLDARIMIVILASIMTVSGALLHNAITKSEASKLIIESNEIAKALDNYVADMNAIPAGNGTLDSSRKINYLYSISTPPSSWRGPYITLRFDPVGFKLINSNDVEYVLNIITKENTWGEAVLPPTFISGDPCPNAPCGMWLGIISNLTSDIANAIDLEVDGVKDGSEGRVRVYTSPSGDVSAYINIRSYIDPSQ